MDILFMSILWEKEKLRFYRKILLEICYMYFFNFEKENEWRLFLKENLSVLEISGTLIILCFHPQKLEERAV